jgi:hypothetical protein
MNDFLRMTWEWIQNEFHCHLSNNIAICVPSSDLVGNPNHYLIGWPVFGVWAWNVVVLSVGPGGGGGVNISGVFAKSDYLASSCLSAWNNRAPHWTDFREIWYLRFFFFLGKSFEKTQIALKSYKNNGYFTWRRFHVFLTISRWVRLRMWNVSDKSYKRKSKHRFCIQYFFFSQVIVPSTRQCDQIW